MTTRIHFHYSFHAVGQGLFASGRLRDQERARQFDWVLDCGSLRTTRAAYLQRELNHYGEEMRGKPIDLFCLSHFDEDHIKGARELLSTHRVDVLVMPYFPLVDRIQIAVRTQGLSEEYQRFLIDPAGYLFEAAGGDNLREIILIAGGGPPEESGRDAPGGPFVPPEDDRFALRYPPTEIPPSPGDQNVLGKSPATRGRSVRVFTHQKPFAVGVWEFMFFNEHIPGINVPALEQKVSDLILKHRRPDGTFDGPALLAALKDLYVRTFGPGGKAQNRISLVVYSGPMDRLPMEYSSIGGRLTPVGAVDDRYYSFPGWLVGKPADNKVGIGYFGDFPLTTPARVNAVRRHFTSPRWDRFQVVQIPHHGSELSWYPKASAEFHHGASVISSARHSKDHPSQSVLDDLEATEIALVNELQRARFAGWIQY